MEKTENYKNLLKHLKAGKEFKIAFIGDSLTSCEWIHPNWRDTFEYILKFGFVEFEGKDAYLPEWLLKFYNYSLDGASTREFLLQSEKAIKEVNPDLVIAMGTSNDYELKISIAEHKTNIEKMFKLLGKSVGHFVYSPDLYSGDTKLNEAYEEYILSLMQIPTEKNQIIVNGYDIFSFYPYREFYTLEKDITELTDEEKEDAIKGKLAIDYVHPNILGNIYIAKMFLENIFGIEVDPDVYLKDLRTDRVKLPRWK